MLRVTIGRACRVKAAGSMCGEGTAAAQVSQTGGRSPLDSQARYATRVGFWKKHRHLRNPEVRIRRPTMMSEDTRSMGMVFFHWHWMYTIRYWKKKFNELLLHKVTEYELQNEHIPKGKSDVVVRAMLRERKGIPFYNDDPLTFRDNPFAKVSTNWQFERERETELTASLMGRLQYRMKMEGISLEEARRQQADMRQRHRAKKTDLRKGKFQKIIDYRLKGRLSTHADEMSTLTSGSGTESGADSGGVRTKPKKAWLRYEYDVDTNHKKILSQPKDNINPKGVHPLVDGRHIETRAGPAMSTTPGSGTVFMGTSSLPDDFAFPVQNVLR